MIDYYVPTDETLLASFGRVAIAHGHLERSLKMTVKTLGGASVREALDQQLRKGPASVRKRIEKLARAKLGQHVAVEQLLSLLKRAEDASEQRHGWVHGVWATDVNTAQAMIVTEDHEWIPIPSAEELNRVASELEGLAKELNKVRLHGSLSAALTEVRPT